MALLKPYAPKPRYIPKIIKHEESIQRRVASYLRKHYPDVDFHSDYAAGLKLTKNQARIRKLLQSGRGWSDMFIAWPTVITREDGKTQAYAGLFLELKKDGTSIYVTRGPRKGKLVQDDQILIEAAFLKRMRDRGYCALFAIGFDDTVRKIDWYLNKKAPENGELPF